MKNLLELTLLEVEALMHGDSKAPESEYTRLLAYLADRQREIAEYKVQEQAKAVRAARSESEAEITRRKARSLDQDLLDHCEIVPVETAS